MSSKAIAIIIIFILLGALGYWAFKGNPEDEMTEEPEVEEETPAEEEEVATTTINAMQGEEFKIVLEANPTTGYEWQIENDEEFIEVVSREFVAAETEEDLVGVGGEETFTFSALQPGQTKITFSYLRPFEEEEPVEEVVYTVNIEE